MQRKGKEKEQDNTNKISQRPETPNENKAKKSRTEKCNLKPKEQMLPHLEFSKQRQDEDKPLPNLERK